MISGLILSAYPWPWVFYFFGIISIVWFIIFVSTFQILGQVQHKQYCLHLQVFLCYSDPNSHPFISKEEREYLEAEIGQLKRNDNLPSAPYLSIITSIPMIALVFAQIGHDWGFYIMVSDLPKYMSDVLQFSIKDNGIYSSLPYLFMWAVSVSTGFLSDFLITRNMISITGARKVFTAVGKCQ